MEEYGRTDYRTKNLHGTCELFLLRLGGKAERQTPCLLSAKGTVVFQTLFNGTAKEAMAEDKRVSELQLKQPLFFYMLNVSSKIST